MNLVQTWGKIREEHPVKTLEIQTVYIYQIFFFKNLLTVL